MTTKTREISICHCVTCGKVEHIALGDAAPVCCGTSMAMTCNKQVNNSDKVEPADATPPKNNPPKRPK